MRKGKGACEGYRGLRVSPFCMPCFGMGFVKIKLLTNARNVCIIYNMILISRF